MTSQTPTVSVIIPTYNRAQYVTKAIDSVLSQSYKHVEVIVVDDGSKDETEEVLEAYRHKIIYLRQQNGGVSSARNTGIRAASGEWVAFLDSDDEWLPDKLSVQMAELMEREGAVLHTTNHSTILARGGRSNYFRDTGFEKIEPRPTYLRSPLIYQIRFGLARAQCAVVRRSALERTGLFDPQLSIYEDQDLMCRLALQGAWMVAHSELVVVHRREECLGNLSAQRQNDPLISFSALVSVYEKLIGESGLSISERRVVNDTLSASLAGLGMELLKIGRRSEATTALRRAAITSPGAKSLVRYLFSLLPTGPAARLARLWHTVR